MSKINNEIIKILENIESSQDLLIPHDKVIEWMKSDNLETLGIVYALLSHKHSSKYIEPEISFENMNNFIKKYFERCFLEDPHNDWSHTRYEAGRDLVLWVIKLWDSAELKRSYLAEYKVWLEKLYRNGNDELRECLVNSTLEHIFERREIAKYFYDWKKDPILGKAYVNAISWSE
jgi:hypothetical protein